jgi:hypothetical protein
MAAGPASPRYFEPRDATGSIFVGRGFGSLVELSAQSFRMGGQDSRKPLGLRLDGASVAARLDGDERLASRAHYFVGRDPGTWRANVPMFARVRARDVYPGTDLVYYGGARGLEFDLVLRPLAKLGRVRLRFNRRLGLDPSGALRDADSGELLLDPPRAYELDDAGGRHSVSGHFRLVADGVAAFAIQGHDSRRTLVIDPTLVYATYLGGSGTDTLVSAQRGPDGGLYVAGYTTSVDLPQAVSLDSILNRPISLNYPDTFVARYTPDGSALVYVVYVGGNLSDNVTSMAVDALGRATVAGFTYSNNFPATAGALQRNLGGRSYDGYCFRLAPDGSALEYSTYLGIVSPQWGYLADTSNLTLLVGVDGQGNAIVAGNDYVFSAYTAIGVVPTPGAFQQKPSGGLDGFLLRLNNSGTGLLYATWFGGSGDDVIKALAVDGAGNAYIAGTTQSLDLPLVRAFQIAAPTGTPASLGEYYSGNTASFFAEIAADGGSALFSSYYGGQRGNTAITSIALDAAGNIYLGGASPVAAVPGLAAVPGATTVYTPNAPGFLTKLDGSGQVLQYAWAYAPLGMSTVLRVRVDASSRPCILGQILASQVTPGALFGGIYDTVGITCLESDGETIRYATLPPYAGMGYSNAADFDFDSAGNPLIALNSDADGEYASALPTTANAPQPNPSFGYDGYIFKLIPDNLLPQLFYASPSLVIAPTGTGSTGTTFTVSGANFAPGIQLLWNGQPVSTANNVVQYLTANTARFSLPVSTLAAQSLGDQQFAVALPAPGGGVSNPLTIKYVNPTPGLLTVSPAVVPAGNGTAVTFTVTGSFTNNSTVTWDGQPIGVVQLSLAQPMFQISVPASAFVQPGNHVIAVTNPPPGGGTATVQVSVTPSGLPQGAPAITGVVLVGVGEAGVTQTISAQNYSASDVTVVWNGADRPTTVSGNSIQFVLTLSDVATMGSAQIQLRSGGMLGTPVTGYVGVRISGSYVTPDTARGRAYLLTSNAAQTASVLVAVSVPGGSVLHTLDLGSVGTALTMTDDNCCLYVMTNDGRIRRLNLDTFAFDTTIAVPPSNSTYYYGGNPAVVPVAGSSTSVAAAGIDGVVRIFDNGVPRAHSSADLVPNPGILNPVFATPNVVWANVGSSSTNNTWCMARLQYDASGFTGLQETCTDGLTGPWGITAAEVQYDSGAVWFQYGSRTLVWICPRSGVLDVATRRILSPATTASVYSIYGYTYLYSLAVYSLDTETQLASLPQSGALPAGSPVPYGSSQVLWAGGSALLLIDLP